MSPELPGPAASTFQLCPPVVLPFDNNTAYSVMDTDYILHRIIRRIASWGVYSFFTEVRVIGGEKVPLNGPIIVYVSYSPRILYNSHVLI